MCRLSFPRQQALCSPRTPPYVREMAQKGPQKPQILCRLAGDIHKPRTGHIFGYMALSPIPRAPDPPAIPTFCGFHPSELPRRMPTPPYFGSLDCCKPQAQTETGGCPNGSSRCNRGRRKLAFLKNDPRPCVMLSQVSLDCFELVVAHFCPAKIPKCLENGLFWSQKWVKNGSKRHFSKTHPRPFGVHKPVKSGRFEPIRGHFGPSKVQKALKVGFVVKEITCKLISLYQRPSMCD